MAKVASWIRNGSVAAAVCFAVSACISSASSGGSIVYRTSVSVSPSAFAGNLPCGTVPQAWQTYVATLIDVTDPANPVQLASSPPVSCAMPVAFTAVTPGHSYVATIDGYDRSDIVPSPEAGAGTPLMVARDTLAEVAPRWRSTCPASWTASFADAAGPPELEAGAEDTDGGTEAEGGALDDAGLDPSIPGAALCWPNTDAALLSCSPLTEVLPSLPGAITLDTSSLRAQLQCGDAPGQIQAYRVVPLNSSHAPRDLACDAVTEFSPVSAGLTYRFRVEAFEAGAAAATWAASCSAVAREGLVVPAACDTLTADGAIRFEIAPILAASGRTCSPDDIVSYRVALATPGSSLELSGCQSDAVLSPVQAGSWQAVLEGLDALQQVRVVAWCEATVQPAAIAAATCTVQ
jgi:hypothetical protein